MQRVMEDNSIKNSMELYLEEVKGDVWTIECKDNCQKDVPLFEPLKHDMKKKIALGASVTAACRPTVPRRSRPRFEVRSGTSNPKLIVSSDCGFGRQGCNREIAFYKASAIAQGCNIVRKELGFETTYVPAADPQLQTDVVPRLKK